ncbi:hypothetical protein [Shewanella donghaensis]|uniref:hypothetical protein n=1 Tax=Shewanella donghaensis TaxID=238836 RepID=UPI001181DAE6|nr:hypothetical protein [Shewanella donghaensis]
MNHQKGISLVIFFIAISCSITTDVLQATEFSQLVSKSAAPKKQTAPDQLPMNVVLDHQGQPITLPAQQSALDYSADEMRLDKPLPQSRSTTNTNTKTNTRTSTKTTSKKLAKKTINDPTCHWLNQRMKQLNSQLKRNKSEPIETELSHRQKEWDCLDCSTTGPSQAQYSQCQYRR